MWNSDDIIRIELGKWIIQEANSPDNRNVVSRWWNGPLEDDVQLLVNGTRKVREYLAENEIYLPPIKFTNNDQIGPKEFIIYWGIECEHYKLDSVHDLLDFIYKKAFVYKNAIKTEDNITNKYICEDQFQTAYNYYVRKYYKSRIQNDFYSCCKCLTEVSTITAQNGDLDLALQFALAAITYSSNRNIVDASLKSQCYFNAGALHKYTDIKKAVELIRHCWDISFTSGNKEYCFFACLTLAEIYGYIQEYKTALTYYKYAERLISDKDIALSIKSEMLHTYELLIEQLETPKTNHGNTKWITIIQGAISDCIKQLTSNAALALVLKMFNINGIGSLFSFGQTINLENNVFNSPICIGDNNRIMK